METCVCMTSRSNGARDVWISAASAVSHLVDNELATTFLEWEWFLRWLCTKPATMTDMGAVWCASQAHRRAVRLSLL